MKRRIACWRLSVEGTVALRRLLSFIVEQQQGETWIDWCRQNIRIVKDRVSYKNSKRLADDPDVPDLEAMDITYLAHILGHLTSVDDEMKGHIKVIKDIRNDLCHNIFEAMDETAFEETCEKLLDAFGSILKPAVKRREWRFIMWELESFAEPAAVDSVTDVELHEQVEELMQRLNTTSLNDSVVQNFSYEDIS